MKNVSVSESTAIELAASMYTQTHAAGVSFVVVSLSHCNRSHDWSDVSDHVIGCTYPLLQLVRYV